MAKKKSKRDSTKKYNQEGIFAILAAFIVLFSAMLDPVISVIISFVLILLYGIYKLFYKKERK
jgi:hypothetical protein